jgi:hypothetical protein
MNTVGESYSGKPNVRLDQGRLPTGKPQWQGELRARGEIPGLCAPAYSG